MKFSVICNHAHYLTILSFVEIDLVKIIYFINLKVYWVLIKLYKMALGAVHK